MYINPVIITHHRLILMYDEKVGRVVWSGMKSIKQLYDLQAFVKPEKIKHRRQNPKIAECTNLSRAC